MKSLSTDSLFIRKDLFPDHVGMAAVVGDFRVGAHVGECPGPVLGLGLRGRVLVPQGLHGLELDGLAQRAHAPVLWRTVLLARDGPGKKHDQTKPFCGRTK